MKLSTIWSKGNDNDDDDPSKKFIIIKDGIHLVKMDTLIFDECTLPAPIKRTPEQRNPDVDVEQYSNIYIADAGHCKMLFTEKPITLWNEWWVDNPVKKPGIIHGDHSFSNAANSVIDLPQILKEFGDQIDFKTMGILITARE